MWEHLVEAGPGLQTCSGTGLSHVIWPGCFTDTQEAGFTTCFSSSWRWKTYLLDHFP